MGMKGADPPSYGLSLGARPLAMGFEAEDPEGAPGAGPVISSSPVVTACYGCPRTRIQAAGLFSSGPQGLVAATGTALPQGFEGSGTEPSGSIVDGIRDQALLPAMQLWAAPTPRGVRSVRGAQALLSEAEWPRGWPAVGPALGGAFRLALEARFGGAPPPRPDLASAAPSPALERSRLPGFANGSAVVVPVRAHPGGGLALLVSLRPGVPDGTCCAVRRCDPRTPREPPELGPFSSPRRQRTGDGHDPPRAEQWEPEPEEDVAVPGGGEPRWPLGPDPRQQPARVGALLLRTHREMSSVGPEGSLGGPCRRREVAWGPCRLGGRTVAALAGRPCPSLLRPHSRPCCGDKQQATPAPAEPGDRSSWDRTLAEPLAPSAPGDRAATGREGPGEGSACSGGAGDTGLPPGGRAAGPRGGSAPSLRPLFVLAPGAPGPVCRLSSTVAALPRQLTGLFPPHSPHHLQACDPEPLMRVSPGKVQAGAFLRPWARQGLADQRLSLGPPGYDSERRARLLLRRGARNLRVAPRKQYSEPAPPKPQMLPEAQLAAAEMMTGATAPRPPVTDTSCRPSAARAGPPLQASPAPAGPLPGGRAPPASRGSCCGPGVWLDGSPLGAR
ncbi:collagen alpha-1(I) chain-like [Canis lupus familiaris]|uniref:collagen alpha-1(I) chain-like n=1 Tax=Canis lupus familiaris TaxID=9615 RepID=UPI0018F3699E|nr:collagen alpha-1(I) chain-like [Canis lupus familiaris]